MGEGDCAVYFLIIACLAVIDVVFYGFRFAITTIHEKELFRLAKDEEDKSAIRLVEYIENPTLLDHLSTSVTTTNHIAMGYLYYIIIVERIDVWIEQIIGVLRLEIPDGMEFVLSLVIILVMTWIGIFVLNTFCNLLPRKLATRNPEKWAYGTAGIVSFVRILYHPFLVLTDVTTRALVRLFCGSETDNLSDVTEEELMNLVNEGHEQGVFEASEAEMIHNILEYTNKDVQDIMTNRTKIIAIESTTKLKDAIHFMLNERNSRYPVYEENLDHIIGILYLKDAMRYHNSDIELDQAVGEIEGLLRKAECTPLTRSVDDLLHTLRTLRLQMAIVIDEYGQTAGLVTMEDILEEIVGNIQDEYDEDEEYIEETAQDSYNMDGDTPLEDIEDQLDISFDDIEFETLNGFLIGEMDHIPQVGEEFDVDFKGYNFKVLSIDKMRVQNVLVTKIKIQEETNEEN
ncbi:MAG: hemolysin family protein [Lachnospiraceae bacterium]